LRKIGDAPVDIDRPVLEFRSRRAPVHGPVAFNPKRQNRWIPAGVLNAPPQLLGLHPALVAARNMSPRSHQVILKRDPTIDGNLARR
jgi:hypothetical protein